MTHRPYMTRAHLMRIAGILVLSLIALASVYAQPAPVSGGSARDFFDNIAGEWIGACEQSTDGEPAENKYFHAVIKQTDDNTYDGQFDYYRLDQAKKTPLHIGNTKFTITIGPDGTMQNKMVGQGIMLVNEKPKNQEHEILENLEFNGNNGIQGKGNGKIAVSGMPLGLGKNGKILNSSTNWQLKDDVITISQSVKAGFSAFVFKKTFNVVANYTAKRGTDVVSLMFGKSRIASKP